LEAVGDAAGRTHTESWDVQVPGLKSGIDVSLGPRPGTKEDHTRPAFPADGSIPATLIGALPGLKGGPLSFMLGSGSGMGIGDRPLNVMRSRMQRARAPVLTDGGREMDAGPAGDRGEAPSFRLPPPRLRGIQTHEFDGSWL
jgi:hypothetical protein